MASYFWLSPVVIMEMPGTKKAPSNGIAHYRQSDEDILIA
jgi:hypothetical protein